MSREFNFDELDKAVNSLISDSAKQPTANSNPVVPQPAPSSAAPAPPVSPTALSPPPPRVSSAPMPTRNIPAAERKTPAAPAPQAPPVATSPSATKPVVEKPDTSGRFMDVMHPTSDMVAPAKEEVKKGIGAEGKTIEPLSSSIIPEPLPEKSAANTPNSAQLTMQTPVNPDAMVTTPDTEEKAWKDPLEEATKNEKEREIKQGAQERLGLTPKPSEKEAKPEDEKKPLFLPDAKVEKRPLGAFAEDNKAEDKAAKEESKDKKDTPAKLTIDGVEDVDKEEKTDDESSDLLLPELGKEIVAVEASDAIASDEDIEKKNEDEDKLKEQDSKKEEKDEKDKKEPVKPATFSIPKQYKEKQASTDHKPKSIYDTEEYHRSLATAAAKKKKNSKWWVWVLVILGLLVLGVGLGAGAYFLVGI